MATTISLTEEAYESLKALKGPEESFRNLVLRLTGAERDKMKGFGAWADTALREVAADHHEAFDRDFEDRQDALSRRSRGHQLPPRGGGARYLHR